MKIATNEAIAEKTISRMAAQKDLHVLSNDVSEFVGFITLGCCVKRILLLQHYTLGKR